MWVVAGLLALVTLGLYWPVTGYDFVNFDDDFYVTANAQVQGGLTWEGIKWACLNPVADNWHPLTVWSHMLVCQLCGLNPWGHHLANVLLHALNGVLVFALLNMMTGAGWRSLLVAALFALHPLRVESVAWVSERKDVLSGFFGLLALIAYVRYAERRPGKAESRKQKAEIATAEAESVGRIMAAGSTFDVQRSMFDVRPGTLSYLPSPTLANTPGRWAISGAIRSTRTRLLPAAAGA